MRPSMNEAVAKYGLACSSADLLPLLVDHSPDALLIVSLQGIIIFANATCADLLGYQPEELVGQPPEILVPKDIAEAHGRYRSAYHAAPTRRAMGRLNSLTALTKGGRIIPVDIALSPITTAAYGIVTAVAIRDATAQRAFVRDLERLATTDPLTGALNRRSFENAFARESERCRRTDTALFVMMLDIDHFKMINDRYGHTAGDVALRALVSSCLSTLRKTDVFARIGGEEFAILSPASDVAEAITLAERLREDVIKISVPAGTGSFGFTVSIGICCNRLGGETVSDSLRHADEALYEAKRGGRNRVVWNYA